MIERARYDLVVDVMNDRSRAWHGFQEIVDKPEVELPVRSDIVVQIHELDREVDPPRRRIRRLRSQDILLPQKRFVAVDIKMRPVVTIGDDGGADNEPFVRLEFYLQGHVFTLVESQVIIKNYLKLKGKY